MHVLICDDNAVNRFVSKRLLTQMLGCTVAECENGAEALSIVGRSSVDLVLLDVAMPVLDGFETLQALRDAPEYKHIPVVIMTAERRIEIVRKFVELGIAGYVLKPLRAEKFRAVIDGVRRNLRSTSQISLGRDTPALLVDGNLNYRQFFVQETERYGPIIQAESGAAAVAMFSRGAARIVFIGEDLGVIKADRLVQKLRAMASAYPIRIVALTEKPDGNRPPGIDALMLRTFVASAHHESIRRFVTVSIQVQEQVVEVEAGSDG